MFPVVRVDSRSAVALEPLGTKGKFWFTGAGGERMLFKAEERGTGEDWAEKVACKLAGLLGLPRVRYELAYDEHAAKPGVVCASLIAEGEALAHGNSLLLALDPNYPAGEQRRYRVSAHTVDAIARALGLLGPPQARWMADAPAEAGTALGVFTGYLMLDAWTANQDRHHENWGAVWKPPDSLSLAPTFDHGAALARQLTDEERAERLTTRDRGRSIAHFATRARSAIYENAESPRPLGTLEAFRAFAERARSAAGAWRDRLRSVDEGAVARVLEQVPPDRLSRVSRDFTLQLLAENRRRVLAL
jgi:hypothetical protein